MKIFSWNVCHGVGNPATVQEFKQLLVANVPDMVFLCETKIQSNSLKRIRTVCRMDGCLAVSSEGKSGGLALLWREGVNVEVQSYSKFHIESVVSIDDGERLRFTGFYGQTNPSLRSISWDILRRVGESVREEWIVGRDFNAFLNDGEKEGGRRGVRAKMNEFKEVTDELALVDIKPDSGWFTWVNNRSGEGLIKERLDRFISSVSVIEKFPFIATKVVRQT
ncbi:hypothetical protein ERO13_1Z049485v2 [Gossypium hirsutum]|nr:hypothetical protein ERO13_1Z049485v2 [Gossypium hirsutum]